jgi:hypothetical protein
MMMGSEKGSVLVIVITGITIIAAIGAGLAAMVSSGARTGANHSLSVQALYAAESGLEWAGAALRDSSDWEDFCKGTEADPGLKGETPPDIKQNVQVFFTIVDSQLYTNEDGSTGCEVTVAGGVGDKANPLAKRQIRGSVSETFINSEGTENVQVITPEEWQVMDDINCEDVDDCFDEASYEGINNNKVKDDILIGNETTVTGDINLNAIGSGSNVFIKNTTTEKDDSKEDDIKKGDINISGKVDVAYIKNTTVEGDININMIGSGGAGNLYIEDTDVGGDIIINQNGQGNVFIGNNVKTGGRVIINISGGGDVCVGSTKNFDNTVGYQNNIEINISGGVGNVCIGDYENLNDASVNISGNSSVCYIKDEGSDCKCLVCKFKEEGEVNQNPVGTEDGSWSEG